MSALLALLLSAKPGKVLFSAGSMLVSLAAYGQLYGYTYAACLVLLLWVSTPDAPTDEGELPGHQFHE